MKKILALLISIVTLCSINIVTGYSADLKQVWISNPKLDNVVSLDDSFYLTMETLSDGNGKKYSRVCRSSDLKNWETINLSFEAKNLYKNGDRFLIEAQNPDINSKLGIIFYESKDGYTWTKLGEDFYGEILYVCSDSNEVGLQLYTPKKGYEKDVSTTDFISFSDSVMKGIAVENASDTLRYDVVNGDVVLYDYNSNEEYVLDFLSISDDLKNNRYICNLYKSYECLLLFDNINEQIYSSSNLQDWEKVTGVDVSLLSDKRLFNYNGHTYLIYPRADKTAYIEHKVLSSDGKRFEDTNAFSFLDEYMIYPETTPAYAVIEDMYDYTIIHNNNVYFRLKSEVFGCNGWMVADSEDHGTYYELPQYEYDGVLSCFEIKSSKREKPLLGDIVMNLPIYPEKQMEEYGKKYWIVDDNNQIIFEQEMPGIIRDVEYRNGYYYCKYFKDNSYVYVTSQDAKNWTIMNINNMSGNASIIEDNDGKIKKINVDNNAIEVVYENENEQAFPNTFYKTDSARRMLTGEEYLYRVDGNKVQFSTDGIYYVEFNCDEELPMKLKLYENDKYYMFARQNSEVVEFDIDKGVFYYVIEKSKFNQKMSFLNNQPPYVVYNSKLLAFEQPPVIQNDRTLIPIRFLFEQMGAEVTWNGEEQTATISQDNTAITFAIDDTEADVNGQTVSMEIPAQLINDKTMVPVRFLSEALGYTVNWDGDTRIITIE